MSTPGITLVYNRFPVSWSIFNADQEIAAVSYLGAATVGCTPENQGSPYLLESVLNDLPVVMNTEAAWVCFLSADDSITIAIGIAPTGVIDSVSVERESTAEVPEPLREFLAGNGFIAVALDESEDSTVLFESYLSTRAREQSEIVSRGNAPVSTRSGARNAHQLNAVEECVVRSICVLPDLVLPLRRAPRRCWSL